jgi:hypothetical protein
MGYTTYFTGSFELSRKLTVTEQETIRAFYDDYDDLDENYPDLPKSPGSSCVWTVSDEGDAIEPLAEEKMYHWDDWIRYICEHVLEPAGVKANGRSVWHGEDVGDSGVIFVKDNRVRLVNIEELAAFMEDACDDLYDDEDDDDEAA